MNLRVFFSCLHVRQIATAVSFDNCFTLFPLESHRTYCEDEVHSFILQIADSRLWGIATPHIHGFCSTLRNFHQSDNFRMKISVSWTIWFWSCCRWSRIAFKDILVRLHIFTRDVASSLMNCSNSSDIRFLMADNAFEVVRGGDKVVGIEPEWMLGHTVGRLSGFVFPKASVLENSLG